jgi:gliding motility-associated-like protein
MKIAIKLIVLILFSKTMISQNSINGRMAIINGTQVSVLDYLSIRYNGELLNDGSIYLSSNLINEGSFSYTEDASTGNVFFNGVDQNFIGTGFNKFYNVSFNNGSTILASTIEIDNDVNFINGIVSNRASDTHVIFNELADHLNTSSSSFIDGNVTKIGDSSFSFPVGNEDTYRKVSIDNLTGTSSFSTIYKFENSNVLYPHDKKSDIIKFIDPNEYWEIKQNDAGSDFVTVEFERNNSTSSSEIMSADISALHVVRWNSEQEFWVDEGPVEGGEVDLIKTVSQISDDGVYALATIYTENVINGDFIVYNNLTPNGDNINDFLYIDGLEKYLDNTVSIVNRDGVVVSEIKGYNNVDKVFRGFSTSSLTLTGSSILPSGTYFFIVKYMKDGKELKTIDYLYINGK